MSAVHEPAREAQADYVGPKNWTLALFLISVLALFLEMLLIRWIGTEIDIFAYLQNSVLVVCFMGLGMGCLTCRQPIMLRNVLLPLLLLVLLLAIPITRNYLRDISLLLSVLGDLVAWRIGTVDNDLKRILVVGGGLTATFILMLFIAGIFIPIGRILGRLMDDHPKPVWAYSVNIAGSLVGIWIFVLLSVFYQAPIIWFLVAAALLLFFIRKSEPDRSRKLILLFGIVIVSSFAGLDKKFEKVLWSPYQKLVLYKTDQSLFSFADYLITVNNNRYQWIVNFQDEKPQLTSSRHLHPSREFSQYDIPFLVHANPESVLIVGAGAGNDVAGALRHGVKGITAVEIDPAIIYLGREYHPERPYDSPGVRVVNDDARSFFVTSKARYDVISFGLLDSHTTTSMTNARLDHYVYTKESLKKTKSLLTKHGILTLTFEPQKPFISDRIARTLRDVFGEEPIYFRIPTSEFAVGGVMFIAGDLEQVRKQIEANHRLSSVINQWNDQYPLNVTYDTQSTTDDWPYFYLPSRHIPPLFYLLAVTVFALVVYTQWRLKLGPLVTKWRLSHWHFFFLGAGFLLLEVQNISKASVVLGNTWWVNAVIISGILVMILLANLTATMLPKFPIQLVYIGLVGSCIALYFVDLARFGFLPYYQKAAVVGVLSALPVFFSGVVFIRSFAYVIGKDIALGANLIGSLVGGLLQSVTFLTGIKALLLIVAGLYCAAMACSPRTPEARQLK